MDHDFHSSEGEPMKPLWLGRTSGGSLTPRIPPIPDGYRCSHELPELFELGGSPRPPEKNAPLPAEREDNFIADPGNTEDPPPAKDTPPPAADGGEEDEQHDSGHGNIHPVNEVWR
jgi:hypothetical protein